MPDQKTLTFPRDDYHPHYPDRANDYYARVMMLGRKEPWVPPTMRPLDDRPKEAARA